MSTAKTPAADVITDRPQYGWSEQQLTYLRDNYKTRLVVEMAPVVGKHEKTVARVMRELGLTLTPAESSALRKAYYKTGSGRAVRKDKGQVKPARAANPNGLFPKGNLPANAAKPGERRQRLAKNNDYMWFECITPGHWREVHLMNYEAAYGPVPDKHVVVFKDGNSLNPAAENLEAIPRGEQIRRARAKNNSRSDQERIIRMRESKSRYYQKHVKPARAAASAETKAKRAAKKAAAAAEKQARREARAAAKKEKAAAQLQAKAAAKVKAPKPAKAPKVVAKPAAPEPTPEELLGPRPNLARQKAKTATERAEKTAYKERVKAMTPAQHHEHLRTQVAGLVPVRIDAKTVVWRSPEKIKQLASKTQ